MSNTQQKIKAQASRLPFGSLLYTIVVSVIGAALIIAGIAMLVLPGPGVLVIFLGLGLLGTEFPWAQRLFQRVKDFFVNLKDRFLSWWRARKGERN